MNEDFQLGALNSRPELDNTTFLNQFIIDEENDFNIFNDTQINSLYFNIETFSTKCRSENKPVVISLNIQSLQSKLNELVTLLTSLSSKNIFIDVIALQEIWAVPYPEAVSIPGYHNIITNCRKIYRGGGVGFYLRDYIEFEKLQNMSPFREKLFESLSIKDLDNLLGNISVTGLTSLVVLDANLNLLTETTTNIDYIGRYHYEQWFFYN